MMIARRQLRSLAVEHPENLVLADNDCLMDLYRAETCDEELQGHCLAELYARWFVGDASRLETVERFLGETTPNGIPDVLLRMRTVQDVLHEEEVRESFASPLWAGADDADDCMERLVRNRLRQLLVQTDGFVPVFNVLDDAAGLFLPFELVSRSGGARSAVDAAGKAIRKWDRPASEILGNKWQMRVRYFQGKDVPELSGRSFLLPLQVAMWKREKRIPDFVPWQLLFTGNIDAGGRIVPVKTEEKAAGVRAVFQQSVKLVAPSDAPYAEESRGIDPLPSDLNGEGLLNAVRTRVERIRGCRLSLDYVRERLPVLDREIRQETVGGWDGQIARVDAMLKMMGRHSEPQRYLQLLMLKSAAYCHSGRTSDALRENARARTFAREKGLAYEALRLEVEQLVEFQDSQRFNDIDRLAKPLLARIKRAAVSNDQQSADLLMRFHGTMGQVRMERGLLGLGKREAEKAKADVEKAIGYARALNSPGDELQDLNYLYLWHALFDPTHEELGELGHEIDGLVSSLDAEGERIKNRAYFRRQQMLACYMKWRLTGEVPAQWQAVRDLPGGSSSWLVASFQRMKGALAAAAGEAATAQRCFSNGDAAFPKSPWWGTEGDVLSWGPVFAQIRLGLLTQAYCSLSALKLRQEADSYRQKALELFAECPSLAQRVGAVKCQEILSGGRKEDPRSLPPFYY